VPGLDRDAHELMRLITLKTAECEGLEESAPWLKSVVAARVNDVEAIPNGHNVIATVDAGPRHGIKRVVCGAPNCRSGIVTAYVPAGTMLGDRKIGAAKIAGVESDGMLASGHELGLNRDGAGILELDAQPGQPLLEGGPDWIIEVDNKSLTHRPDLWGHHGMARDVAAITGEALREPADPSRIPQAAPAWRALVEDYSFCPRYSALVFENVRVEPSPLWLQARLEAIGLNPISNVVDATNYVMAEIGQPMHAFDADRLRGNTIYVRPAKECEEFLALNGERYVLSPANLVIADAGGAVALAGIIGGLGSAIGGTTTRIVLESANFQAASIRKTSSQIKLRTDASIRFEKAQDPVNTVRGLARAVELLARVCPGISLVGGLVDAYQPPPARAPIELPLDWLAQKLGRTVEESEVRVILSSLQFGVSQTRPGVLTVIVPSWRATRDITIKDDLLEEVGRMIGYDQIPPEAPRQPVRRPWVNRERHYHHDVRALASSLGYTETYNYSFLSEDAARLFGWDPADHVRVTNPISSEQSLLRTSLLPGMYRNLIENSKRFDEFRLFEIGSEIHKRGGDLPEECTHFMAAIYSKGDGAAALFELKRLASDLMPGCEAKPGPARIYEHPARVALIEWRGAETGRLFELHPSLLDGGRGAFLDVDLKRLLAMGSLPVKYEAPRKYPSSAFDLSVIVGLRSLAGEIQRKIVAYAGSGLDSVVFLRQYTGAPLAEGQKSLSFRLSVSSPDHTFSSDEVTAIRDRVIEGLQAEGLELRL
jgi:phenylalanyl-tRNA synthetase beta chain